MSLPAHHYDDNHYPLLVSPLLPLLDLQILHRLGFRNKTHIIHYYKNEL